MLRTHTCGELRISNITEEVLLCGWVARIRDKGGMIWIDLRDRYGITQLSLEEGRTEITELVKARALGREFVLRVRGTAVMGAIEVKN